MENPIDTLKLSVPLLIRLLEFSREGANDDLVIHKLTENMLKLSQEKPVLSSEDYNQLVPWDKSNHKDVKEETAKSLDWWNSQSDAFKKEYLKKHPNSSYALHHHLDKKGWVKKGRGYHHPESGRTIGFKNSGTHKHHIVITHKSGDVSEHKTDSPNAIKNIVSKMAIPAPEKGKGISKALSKQKGSLHHYFGLEPGEKLPMRGLAKLAKSDHMLAKRAQLVLNLKRARAKNKG